MNFICETNGEHNAPLPASALAQGLFLFDVMMAKGRGDFDHSGVVTAIEDLTGIKGRTIS